MYLGQIAILHLDIFVSGGENTKDLHHNHLVPA